MERRNIACSRYQDWFVRMPDEQNIEEDVLLRTVEHHEAHKSLEVSAQGGRDARIITRENATLDMYSFGIYVPRTRGSGEMRGRNIYRLWSCWRRRHEEGVNTSNVGESPTCHHHRHFFEDRRSTHRSLIRRHCTRNVHILDTFSDLSTSLVSNTTTPYYLFPCGARWLPLSSSDIRTR